MSNTNQDLTQAFVELANQAIEDGNPDTLQNIKQLQGFSESIIQIIASTTNSKKKMLKSTISNFLRA